MGPASKTILLAASIALLASTAFAQGKSHVHRHPTGKGYPEAEASRYATTYVGANGIDYHGGPVMLGTVKVYYIWYGNWNSNTAISILENFARYIGGTPYYRINTTYYDSQKRHVSNSVKFGGATNDWYSRGTTLTDMEVQQVVTDAVKSGRLPKDTNGVYFVLSSKDVSESSGFCTNYCGWHSHGWIASANLKYAFVGNAARCPSACEPQTKSPNGNPGADAMASIIAHELEEAVTDPNLDAWYDDVHGEENADICAWTFGGTYKTANGSLANMQLGTKRYLIQQNWVNAKGGYCSKWY
jgi:hypothetical protein